jgi:hypothetical protein
MQAQPYRKGPRQPGAALSAMLRGRSAGLANPQDVKRRTMKQQGLRAGLQQRAAAQGRGKR